MKRSLNRLLRPLGLRIVATDRLSLELESDLRRICGVEPVRCIFDVGANVGQSAARFSREFASAQIYSFEPVKQTFARLQTCTATLSRARVFNRAMGAVRGRLPIYAGSDSGTSSMIATSTRAASGTEEVDVDTLDLFCADNAIDRIDLLKIDVEGFEPQVLAGADQMLRESKIRFVYVECEFTRQSDAPHASFFDLHERMSSRNYCVAGIYPESFDLRRGALHVNALFACASRLPPSAAGRIRNIV
jgi:FkbM family methyltransferase